MQEKWRKRFEILKGLAMPAIGGVILFVAVFWLDPAPVWYILLIFVLVLPGFIYLFVVTIWHSKDRYKGDHSDLWGALLLIESSGWFKLVYLFRHLIPDIRGTGRYYRF